MKLCLLIFIIGFVSFSEGGKRDEWKAGMRQTQEECKKISELDDETFKYLTETGNVNEKDRKVVDYVYCLVRKVDFIDERGNLKANNIDAHLERMEISPDIRKETKETCENIQKPDVPLLSTRYYDCYAQFLPRNVLIV